MLYIDNEKLSKLSTLFFDALNSLVAHSPEKNDHSLVVPTQTASLERCRWAILSSLSAIVEAPVTCLNKKYFTATELNELSALASQLADQGKSYVVREADLEVMNEVLSSGNLEALVAQRLEQDAHNVLVGGSTPSEGTIFLPEEDLIITDHEERAAIYEQALREIVSITKVESALDRSAESFFFVASRMRKIAMAAMKRTGAQ